MDNEELRRIDEKLNKLAKGIALHLEILQGQIGERIDQIDQSYSDRLVKIDSFIEGKRY
ncbi:hypothetical protein [Fredinandcohnia sp. 179-A 10B2 NHS]|uniref:hypothetical protein n=1 Tax=Fredinandcohnia sp. 179-A 10B2 NHS TaxID=3235176 RepID=UPI0039A2A3B0